MGFNASVKPLSLIVGLGRTMVQPTLGFADNSIHTTVAFRTRAP